MYDCDILNQSRHATDDAVCGVGLYLCRYCNLNLHVKCNQEFDITENMSQITSYTELNDEVTFYFSPNQVTTGHEMRAVWQMSKPSEHRALQLCRFTQA